MTGYMITTGDGHLADAVLMQLLDGEELSPAGARDHLLACDSCSERLGLLRKAGDLLHGSLLDVAMPDIALRHDGQRRRPWVISFPMAAAATFLIIASAAAATPAVREWILRGISRSTPPATTPSAPPDATAPIATGVIASFAPTDTVLLIRVERRQRQGGLELDASASDRVSAQAIGGGAEELVVLPGELRIANTATSSADYRIRIPASVRVVRVVVGGQQVAVVRSSAEMHRRVELR